MNQHVMQSMRSELEKQALGAPQRPGKMESKLPWYSSAGGGMLGHAAGGALAKRFLPKKLQLAGQLAGTLVGTGLGLESGTALGKKLDKTAAKGEVGDIEKKPSKMKGELKEVAAKDGEGEHPGVTLAKSLAGFGTGMGAGYLAARGANAALKRSGADQIPRAVAYKAIPILTGLGGLAYTTAQQRTLDKMRQQHLKRQLAKAP